MINLASIQKALLPDHLYGGRRPRSNACDTFGHRPLALAHLQGVTTGGQLRSDTAPAALAFAVDEQVTPGDEGGPSNKIT